MNVTKTVSTEWTVNISISLVTNQNYRRISFSYPFTRSSSCGKTLVLLARTLKVYNTAGFLVLRLAMSDSLPTPQAHCLQKCWTCLQRVWRLREHKNIYSLGYRKVNYMEACFYFIFVTAECSFDCAYWVSFLEGGERADSTTALP